MAAVNQNSFDGIAGVYDLLARLVFGNRLHRAQCMMLPEISEQASVLILGGGTGKILDALFLHQPDVQVTYVEKSERMIHKAKCGLSPLREKQVLFVHAGFEDWDSDQLFDIVLCPFFLDLFTDTKLEQQILPAIKQRMKPAGKLLVTDFTIEESSTWNKCWQRILLKVMYRFFKYTARLEASNLPCIHHALTHAGFVSLSKYFFCGNMVFAAAYAIRQDSYLQG